MSEILIPKYYILAQDGSPLCWNEQAIEFTNIEAANRFIESMADVCFGMTFEDFMKNSGAIFAYGNIPPFPGGFMNCDGKVIVRSIMAAEGYTLADG